MRRLFSSLAALLVPLALSAQTPAANPADVATPEAVVKALYETVGRAPGARYNWPRMRTLFLPGALMLPNPEQTGGTARVLSVEDFVTWIDGATTYGGPNDRGFAEEQVHAVVERYGDIAHVFSTYQKHLWKDPNILGRGVNTIQVVYRQNRWWIVAISWDEENAAGPLPAKYLP